MLLFDSFTHSLALAIAFYQIKHYNLVKVVPNHYFFLGAHSDEKAEGVCSPVGMKCYFGICSTNATCGIDSYLDFDGCADAHGGKRGCFCCK